jgi:hypothetical protein
MLIGGGRQQERQPSCEITEMLGYLGYGILLIIIIVLRCESRSVIMDNRVARNWFVENRRSTLIAIKSCRVSSVDIL